MIRCVHRALSLRWFMAMRIEVAQAELDAALNERARSHLPFQQAVENEHRFLGWCDTQLAIERATA